MDPADCIDPHIMTAIANMVGLRPTPRITPGLLELSMFGRLELDSTLLEDYDREVTYTYWPDHNSYRTTYPDNRCTRSSLYPQPFKPTRTNQLPKPQYFPDEPDPTQVEKQDKKVKAKSVKKRIKKRRQKERKRLEKLKREQQKPKKNAEENGETAKTKKTDKAAPLSSGAGPDGQSSSTCDSDSSDDSGEDSESESETEELDLTSSFVNKAALIVKRKLEQKEPKHKPERKEEKKAPVKPVAEPTKDEPVRELPDAISAASINNKPTYDDNVKISTELAMLGNQHASAGRFDMAVKYFTAAIKYNPKEFKLFGNRSFCFEKMQQHEKALTDAQLSLNMAPGWDKGLYRMGRALVGLKRYDEAASTFKEVLKLDSSCTEAAQELMRVQITQLMECGYTREQSSNALIIHGTLSKAMEVLSKLNPSHTGTIYKAPILPPAVGENLPRATAFSSGNLKTLPSAFQAEHDQSPNKKPITQNTSNVVPKAGPNPGHTVKTNPENPKPPPELFPIWVGNVPPTTTVSMLSDLFISAGRIHSIKVLSGKRCAFVNFTTQEHCDQAIRQYHGVELMGSKLALRYPDRIPQGMGMSKAALKAEHLQEDVYWHRESGHWRK
ncbi:unnamed protein product [Lota lota]